MSWLAPRVAQAALVLGALLLVVYWLVVLGAFVPRLPAFGILGASWSERFQLLVLAGVAGLAWTLTLLVRRPGVLRAVGVGATVLALVGSGIVAARLVAFAHRHDVDLRLAGLAPALPSHVAPDATYRYGSSEGRPLRLSVWRPAGAVRDAPLMLFVHGGGWIAGDRLESAVDQRWFAERGWVVASIDYTLSTRTRHLWDVTETQVGCAMAWLGEHAHALGADVDRLSLTGESAGGNLALNAAYRANQGALRSSCGGTVPSVDAVSVLYPAADPAGFHANRNLLVGDRARFMTEAYVGGSPRRYPGRYRAVASATHVTAKAPPTQITVGAHDHLIPPRGSFELEKVLRRAGVRTRLLAVPFAEHVFDRVATGVGGEVYRVTTARWITAARAGPR